MSMGKYVHKYRVYICLMKVQQLLKTTVIFFRLNPYYPGALGSRGIHIPARIQGNGTSHLVALLLYTFAPFSGNSLRIYVHVI